MNREKLLRIGRWLAAIGALATLAGCEMPTGARIEVVSEAKTIDTPAQQPPTPVRSVALLVPSISEPLTREEVEAATESATLNELAMNLQSLTNPGDAAAQVAQAKRALAQHPVALAIRPVDEEAMTAAAKLANKAQIPIFAIDWTRPVEGATIDGFVGRDEAAAGRAAAADAARLVAMKPRSLGRVLVLTGGGPEAAERAEGFLAGLQGATLRVAARESAGGDRVQAVQRTTEALKAHPDVDLVFACTDAMAIGAAQAAHRLHRFPQVIGCGGDFMALRMVRKHVLSATIALKPREAGSKVIDLITKRLAGGAAVQTVRVSPTAASADNADELIAPGA